MNIFLKSFLLLTLLYHVLVTIGIYGIGGGLYPQYPAFLRDGVWIIFLLIIALSYWKHIQSYLKQWKWIWISYIILVLFGIGISLFFDKSLSTIFIGIKYGFYPFFILLSSTFVGYILGKDVVMRFFTWLFYSIIFAVGIGFLWQGAKLIWPNLFFDIGYGPLNDFVFGVKPPLYYLTGYEGTLRRQGIFAGPNNYGYFLIAFFSFITLFLKSFWVGSRKIIVGIGIFFLLLAIGMTLSRSALIGLIVSIILSYRDWIKKHKFISLLLVFGSIGGVVLLSLLKGSSTLGHITAKFGSLSYLLHYPWGMGLGTSGPAIHHQGTLLPENFFLQIMIDIGIPGFILFIIFLVLLRKKHQSLLKGNSDQTLINYQSVFGYGFLALLSMGIFLHVFEDSMVNYIFFIARGILLGINSSHSKKNL